MVKPKKQYSTWFLGIATNRDEWVYDYSVENLEKKRKYFSSFFNDERNDGMALQRILPLIILLTGKLNGHRN